MDAFDSELYNSNFSNSLDSLHDTFTGIIHWLEEVAVDERAAALVKTKLEEAAFWAAKAVVPE